MNHSDEKAAAVRLVSLPGMTAVAWLTLGILRRSAIIHEEVLATTRFANLAVGERLFLVILTCLVVGGFSCEATLVIGVPNQEGILIISDRLGHDTLTGYSDDIEKVVRLSPTAAIAMTGSAIFSLGKRDGTNTITKDRLDGWDLAKGYFSTNTLEKFNERHFADCMSEQLSNYFVRINFKLPSPEPTGTQFIIFRATPAKECLTYVVLLMLTQTESGIRISTQCQQVTQPDNVPAQILAFGNAELPLELRQGHDPRFKGLRSDAVIASFLPEPPKIKKVKLSEARIFARKVMAEAAAKTELINPHSIIGTNLDDDLTVQITETAVGEILLAKSPKQTSIGQYGKARRTAACTGRGAEHEFTFRRQLAPRQ